MWQMAAILEFLSTFSLHLRLRGSFTPDELEVAIVSETAQTGLLANLHQVRYPNIHAKGILGMPNFVTSCVLCCPRITWPHLAHKESSPLEPAWKLYRLAQNRLAWGQFLQKVLS